MYFVRVQMTECKGTYILLMLVLFFCANGVLNEKFQQRLTLHIVSLTLLKPDFVVTNFV